MRQNKKRFCGMVVAFMFVVILLSTSVTAETGPDLAITLKSTAGSGVVHDHEIIRFTVEVENKGKNNASNVKIKSIIPEGFTHVKWELVGGFDLVTHEPIQGFLEWNEYPEREILNAISELKPGEKRTVEYEVRVDELQTGINEKAVESFAIVTSDGFNGELKSKSINNIIKRLDLIVTISNLNYYSIYKTILEGDETTYRIKVLNISEKKVKNVSVSVELYGFDYVGAYIWGRDDNSREFVITRDTISYNNFTNTITGNINPNEDRELWVTVKAKKSTTDEIKTKAELMVKVETQGMDTHRAWVANYIEKINLDFIIEAGIKDQIIKEGTTLECAVIVKNNNSTGANLHRISVNIPEGIIFTNSERRPDRRSADKIEWIPPSTFLEGQTLEYKFTLTAGNLPKGVNQKNIEISSKLITYSRKAVEGSPSTFTIVLMEEKTSNILTYVVTSNAISVTAKPSTATVPAITATVVNEQAAPSQSAPSIQTPPKAVLSKSDIDIFVKNFVKIQTITEDMGKYDKELALTMNKLDEVDGDELKSLLLKIRHYPVPAKLGSELSKLGLGDNAFEKMMVFSFGMAAAFADQMGAVMSSLGSAETEQFFAAAPQFKKQMTLSKAYKAAIHESDMTLISSRIGEFMPFMDD